MYNVSHSLGFKTKWENKVEPKSKWTQNWPKLPVQTPETRLPSLSLSPVSCYFNHPANSTNLKIERSQITKLIKIIKKIKVSFIFSPYNTAHFFI